MAKEKFVSLARADDAEMAVPSSKGEEIKHYPSFYLSSTKTSIPDEKIGKEFTADVKLFIQRKTQNITTRSGEKKQDFSYDIEVRAMRTPETKDSSIQSMIESGLEKEISE